MDLILDSNAYLADIRMSSINFKNLFDYLRRTKSQIVLPRLVREEVVAKHVYRLQLQMQKTGQAIKDYNRLVLEKTDEIHFYPTIKYSARDLRRKLQDLTKQKIVRYYPDVTDIDINEVYLRGIKRKRPANKQGEELRDVILWFIVLNYAEKENKEIAFITNDNGFWDADQPHQHITEDIASRKVQVRIFHNIEEFIKESAPAPRRVEETRVTAFFDFSNLKEKVTKTLRQQLLDRRRLYSMGSIMVRSMELLKHTISYAVAYDIDQNTQFMEVTYALDLTSELVTEPPLPMQAAGFGSRPDLSGVFGSVPNTRGALFAQNFFLENPLANLARPTREAAAPSVTEWLGIEANARVLLRVIGGALSEFELDQVEIVKIERAVLAELNEMPEAGTNDNL